MATWDELDNKDGSDKDEGEANLALMAITPSKTKYESTFDSNSDGEDEVSEEHIELGPSEVSISEVRDSEVVEREADHITVSQNGWDDFFDMLYGFTYPNMIKELWVNTSIHELNLDCAILSVVSGVPITITPTTVANAINYEDEGVVLDILFSKSCLSPHIIFDDLSDLSKLPSLNSKALVWYYLLISNCLPKNKDLNSLDIDENYFLLLINSYLKINLPQVMFDYLKMTLTSFHKGNSCFIPYGRVLFELLIQQVVEKTMIEINSQSWGEKLKLTEALKVADPFKVKVVSVDGSSSSV
ncbi:hypothetical protein KIW84_015218 [Lathyrus oleraceus]|uniref:Putative plant transposon protein domain-containing protein n=1 Tax=Pisum sativum TaxID=3888 RepID=A0A9D5H0B8_PEA|nr:hypothetical protein KIW84_015218 [Pisum sativum]